MRKFLLLTVGLFISFVNFGQCPPDILIFSQADVDNFATQYPDCTVFSGGLIRVGIPNQDTDVVNLDGLSQIQVVSGAPDLIIIRNPMLESITGLEAVTEVNIMQISLNPLLTSLDGLQNITTAGSINFDELPLLEGIDPMQNVNITGQGLVFPTSFARCPLITTFDGFFAPDSNLEKGFALIEMDGLTNLDGFETIVGAGEQVRFRNNANLQNLDGISNLSGDIGGLSIFGNQVLTDISGFSGVTGLNGYEVSNAAIFRVDNNPLLTNLDGLEGIRSNNTNGNTELFSIQGNTSLSNISALAELNFTEIDELEFELQQNPMLSECDINSICELLENSGNATVTISNNGVDCSSIAEVQKSCTLAFNDISVESGIRIYPNPVADQLIISVNEQLEYIHTRVYSIHGVELISTTNHQLEMSGMSAGICFVKITTKRGTVTKKIIKN